MFPIAEAIGVVFRVAAHHRDEGEEGQPNDEQDLENGEDELSFSIVPAELTSALIQAQTPPRRRTYFTANTLMAIMITMAINTHTAPLTGMPQ